MALKGRAMAELMDVMGPRAEGGRLGTEGHGLEVEEGGVDVFGRVEKTGLSCGGERA
jgi:hypothetical protein